MLDTHITQRVAHLTETTFLPSGCLDEFSPTEGNGGGDQTTTRHQNKNKQAVRHGQGTLYKTREG